MQCRYRMLELECFEDDDNITVDELLRRRGISRRLITLLKRTQMGITRDDALCRTIDRVSQGDKIILKIPESSKEKEFPLEPNFDLKVPAVYEDEDIIVYDKPAGMAVHQSLGHRYDTLANVFAAAFPGLPFRCVNRLDRDTSGLCLAAKNRHSANISADKVKKVYFAVCRGVISEPVRIEAPIAREYESMIKRVVRDDGQYAATNVIPLRSGNDHTLLEIHLETGRTHQIRVHLAHIGHPLAGDTLYGGSTELISRQALHCGKMTFVHPVKNVTVDVCSELPKEFLDIIG